MKTVAVSAVGLRKGGTLRILQQTLEYLSGRADVHTIALVHDRKLCDYPGIEYIEIPWATRSWVHRLWCEYVTMHRISKEIAARPVGGAVGPAASGLAAGAVAGAAGPVDLWLSLHDTTPRVVAKEQEVYCHTSFPFLKLRLRDFVMDPKIPAFRLLTPLYYRIGARKNASIIVQQEWFADALSRLMRVPRDRFRVIPPASSVPVSAGASASVGAVAATAGGAAGAVAAPAVAAPAVAAPAVGAPAGAAAAGVAGAAAVGGGAGAVAAPAVAAPAVGAPAGAAAAGVAGATVDATAAPPRSSKIFFDPDSPRELAARISELVAAGARNFFYASTADCHKNFETLLEAVRIFNAVSPAPASTSPVAGTETPLSVPGVTEKLVAGTETPLSVPGVTEKLDAGTETPLSVPGATEKLVAGTETPLSVPGVTEKLVAGTETPLSVPGVTEKLVAGAETPLSVPGSTEKLVAGTETPLSVPGVTENLVAGTETPLSVPGSTEKLDAGTETPLSVPGVTEKLVAGTETPLSVPGATEKLVAGTETPLSVPGATEKLDAGTETDSSVPASEMERSKVNFTITVRGDENRYARWLHKRWGTLPNVDFHGLMARDELYEYYRSADVFVFPSRVETWGLPISEYAAAHPGGTLLLADLPYARGH